MSVRGYCLNFLPATHMSQKQAAVARATAGKRCCCVDVPCPGRRPPGTEHPPRSQRAPRGSWSSSRSLASVVLAVLHRRAVHEDARLERSSCMWRLALRETPGRHVLVVGAPGVLVAEIADLLREREAERREPLDQPREVLLVQRLQVAGLRLFGGGRSGSSSESSELATPWRPLREARSRLESRRARRSRRACPAVVSPLAARDRLDSVVETSFQSLQFHEGIFGTCLFLALINGIPVFNIPRRGRARARQRLRGGLRYAGTMASLTALSESDAAAVARYKETAVLSRGRLAEIQAEAAAHARAGGSSSHSEAEWMARYAREGSPTGLAGSQVGRLLLTRPRPCALGRMSWLCTMLLNTSEEALHAKHALMRAREQHISDQLQAFPS